MSNQADVRSIDALKEFRVALALYSEETLAALGAVEAEVKRTVQWLQHDRRMYWQEQIKRRREQVAMAKAEVFRRKLQKTPEHTPAFSEQKEILRQAEASLHDAEMRAAMVKKWEPALQHAVLEYHGSIRRIKDLASGDVPRGMIVLEKIIDALEAYLRAAPPSASDVPVGSIANPILDEDASTATVDMTTDAGGESSSVEGQDKDDLATDETRIEHG
jgi:hypothetical protein